MSLQFYLFRQRTHGLLELTLLLTLLPNYTVRADRYPLLIVINSTLKRFQINNLPLTKGVIKDAFQETLNKTGTMFFYLNSHALHILIDQTKTRNFSKFFSLYVTFVSLFVSYFLSLSFFPLFSFSHFCLLHFPPYLSHHS